MNINHRRQTSVGFTIVELLIVVVVIAILAAITIVAYNGIQQRAARSALQSEVSQAAKKILTVRTLSGQEAFPATDTEAGISGSTGTLKYIYEPLTNAFCVQSTKASVSYFATNLNGAAQEGDCSDSMTGLLGWWKMNNNATDSSLSGFNGTIANTTGATGQNGAANQALSFDGTSSSFSVPHVASQATDMQTVSLWVNPNAITATTIFAAKRSAAGNGWLLAQSTSTIFFDCGGSTRRYSPGVTVPTNAWSHVVATCSASGQMAMYINGVSTGASSVTGVRSQLATSSVPLKFGIDSSTDQFYLNGRLDDIRLYNRVLDQSDVQALYNRGAQ